MFIYRQTKGCYSEAWRAMFLYADPVRKVVENGALEEDGSCSQRHHVADEVSEGWDSLVDLGNSEEDELEKEG